ncbi:MAG: hypothetical protein VCF24_03655 [Candidatus Latescibacterota bacterium]
MKTTSVHRAGGRALFHLLIALGAAGSVQAQRHPESAGALPYYNPEPGTPREPAWKLRPPFIRGPRDRFARGSSRAFLGADTGVPYTNYADEKYILYFRQPAGAGVIKQTGRPLLARNVRWDRMGNYMGADYQRVLSIEESRSDVDFSGSSFIDHMLLQFYVGHYTYKNLNWTTTVGNGVSRSQVRTIFTPLTFANSQLNVIRMDLNYKDRDRGTLFYSRGGEQGVALLFSGWAKGSGGDSWDQSPVLQLGTHWQHNLGDYATFGGSFVNQIMASPASPRSSFWRGDLPYDMLAPKTIRVFVADDSPEETRANARVFDVDVIVDGERGGEAVRMTSLDGDPDYAPDLEAAPPTGGTPLAGGGREAVGKETVIYVFTLPTDVTVRSARFVADVAGDYRIGVRQTHDFFSVSRSGDVVLDEMEWPASFNRTDGATRRPHKWYVDDDEEPYYTLVRSRGSDGTSENRRLVSFDYGIPTGQSLASVNWTTDLVGLNLSGEVAHNLRNLMYPVGSNEGNRSSERAWAWWVKGVKDLAGGLAVGAELYRMEPDYAGGYDSYRGGLAFHVDRQGKPGDRLLSKTQEFPLHEDNDDHDRFPDDHPSDSAVAQPRELYPGYPNAQVYPGLDLNVDNIPDVDRNENFIVDWDEPFLTYDSEPSEFVYGIDFNNNGVPDFRENDDKPDYPYPRDQKGQHVFLRFSKLGALGNFVTVGRYDNRQVVGGGVSEAVYLRYEYELSKRGVGQLTFNFDTKKVKDDIADHTYLYRVPPIADSIGTTQIEYINWYNKTDGPPELDGFRRPATPDPLSMRDSRVHLAFLDSKYVGFRGINLETSLLWFRNGQAEIELDDGSGLLQSKEVQTRFAVSNKIDYLWTRGSWHITPKFKHRTIYEKRDSEEGARVSYTEFIPIVMGEYTLTPKTSFLAGAQGMPLLPFKHWDRGQDDDTFRQTDYTFMFKLTADYFGIRDNAFYCGYQRTRKNFGRSGRPDFKQGILFAELISPF